jgi:antitoxin VapB
LIANTGAAMPLNIRSEEVNMLAERLATRTGLSKTAAVKRALENELDREVAKLPMLERIREIQDRFLSFPPTGLEADKAFFDELSGDL